MSKTIGSWSPSRLQVYESCPYQARLKWIDKIPETAPKKAAERGTEIHSEAENFVMNDAEFTKNLRKFHPDFLALRLHAKAGRVSCEEEWGFDREWKPTEWKTAWLRMKCDAVLHLSKDHIAIIDYKTGQRFGNEIKHAEQLQMYAIAGMLRYPDIQLVTTELWYLDQDELASFQMTKKSLPRYIAIFDKRGKNVTDSEDHPPNPNVYSCKYCPFHASKQGNCAFGADLSLGSTGGGAADLPASPPLDM